CPSTEEWIRKMWFIYTMEYYAAEKNNDIMKFASKWMELENVILSESEFLNFPPLYGRNFALERKSYTTYPEEALPVSQLEALSCNFNKFSCREYELKH
ncbi:hypothetical protein STEG23_024311, partial [Scotinomys teguina]